MTRASHLAVSAAAFAALWLVVPIPSNAQASKPIQVQDTNTEGVTAELIEAVRKEGVLTVKIRYRNAGSAPAKLNLTADWRDVDQYYVVAGSTKFLILKDDKKVPVMSALDNYGGL